MATNNSVNTTLAGQTGTGTFVGSTSPTLVTPTIGDAIATSVTFNPTTSGIVGTTTNNDAAAGKVGEFISSVIPAASGVSLSNLVPLDVTSIFLTAGDWDVWGNVSFQPTGVCTNVLGWISSTSATLPDVSVRSSINVSSGALGTGVGMVVLEKRFSLAGNTTIYLTGDSAFSSGTCKANGGIYARRVR